MVIFPSLCRYVNDQAVNWNHHQCDSRWKSCSMETLTSSVLFMGKAWLSSQGPIHIYIYTYTYILIYIYIYVYIYIQYVCIYIYIYASLPLRSTFLMLFQRHDETHCILQRKSKHAVSLISIPSRKLFEPRLRSIIGIWYFKYCRKVCRNVVCTKFSWKKHQIHTQYQGVWWKHWQCFSSNNKQHSEKKCNMWKDAIHPLWSSASLSFFWMTVVFKGKT